MSRLPNVLLLGSTGRTGRHVLDELTTRGAHVRAIVRSPQKLSKECRARPNLELVEASLLEMSKAEFEQQVRSCDAVVSCLGHVMNLRGVFGQPRDLVTQAVTRIVEAARTAEATSPKRLVVMSSVSVNRPDHVEPRRGSIERAVLTLVRCLVPPAKDNQAVADFLLESVGTSDPHIEWVVVRPDTLVEGDPLGHAVHESVIDGLFSPGRTTMQSLARFYCELITENSSWDRWRGGFPVIVSRNRHAGRR